MASTDESKFTAEDVAAIVSYDKDSGELSWAPTNPASGKRGRPIRSKSHGYIYFRLLGGHAYGHRVAWLLHHGRWPKHNIDHINGDRSDNRIANLRDVTDFANTRNRRGVKVARMVEAVPAGEVWDAVVFRYGRAESVGKFATAHEATTAAAEVQNTIAQPMRPRPQVVLRARKM